MAKEMDAWMDWEYELGVWIGKTVRSEERIAGMAKEREGGAWGWG